MPSPGKKHLSQHRHVDRRNARQIRHRRPLEVQVVERRLERSVVREAVGEPQRAPPGPNLVRYRYTGWNRCGLSCHHRSFPGRYLAWHLEPTPTSSSDTIKTFGAPLDGCSSAIGGCFVSGSFAWPVVPRVSTRSGIGNTEHRSSWPSFAMSDVFVRRASRRASLREANPVCAARVPRGKAVAEEVERAQPPLADLPGERHCTDQAARRPYRLHLRTPAHPRPQPLRHLVTLERLASARRLLDRRAERSMLVTRATAGLALRQLRTAKANRTLLFAPALCW
jgi:hypothetical protein